MPADKPEKKPPQHRNIPKLNITADEKTRAGLKRIIETTGCRSQSAAIALAVAEWIERRDAK